MNLQNIPRDDKTIKRGFKPKLDALFFADYKAIEYRVTAFYMHSIGFPQWANNFRAGLDPHEETAKMLGSTDRQFGKKFNFASIYGAGVGELKDQLKEAGIPVPAGKTVKQLHAQFHATNPGIRGLSWPAPLWEDRESKRVPGAIDLKLKLVGCIKTMWGRELHPVPYKSLNALVQGCSADLMRASMVNVHYKMRNMKSHMVMSVHDELIFDCVDEEIAYLAEHLPAWMSDERLEKVVPIEIDLEISHDTWADKESYADVR